MSMLANVVCGRMLKIESKISRLFSDFATLFYYKVTLFNSKIKLFCLISSTYFLEHLSYDFYRRKSLSSLHNSSLWSWNRSRKRNRSMISCLWQETFYLSFFWIDGRRRRVILSRIALSEPILSGIWVFLLISKSTTFAAQAFSYLQVTLRSFYFNYIFFIRALYWAAL